MRNFCLTLMACVSLLLIGVGETTAQDNKGKRLQFVYIDHEVTTPTSVLNQRLTQRFYDIAEFPDQDAMVLYLSNGRLSPVAFVNLKEYASDYELSHITASGMPRDNEGAFKEVLEAMNQANSHTVNARADMDNIFNLLDKLQVFDQDGRLNFKVLRFDFYVGPNFWLLRNNEKVIAHLFTVLSQGLHDDDKGKVSFNVLKPADVQLEYRDGKPFGEANMGGINESISVMDY